MVSCLVLLVVRLLGWCVVARETGVLTGTGVTVGANRWCKLSLIAVMHWLVTIGCCALHGLCYVSQTWPLSFLFSR